MFLPLQMTPLKNNKIFSYLAVYISHTLLIGWLKCYLITNFNFQVFNFRPHFLIEIIFKYSSRVRASLRNSPVINDVVA